MISKNRIFDCITFFDENLLTNSRFEILNNVVDYFIVCESKYDHKGRKKKINFKLLDTLLLMKNFQIYQIYGKQKNIREKKF